MAKKSGLTDARVGLFVLLALAVLTVGSLWVAGSSWLGVQQVHYGVLLKNSGGVQPGDRVRFAGVAVGRVHSVDLRPDDEEWPVHVQVHLDPGIPIRADSSAHIMTAGLLGSSLLTIVPGSPEQPLLPPGSDIHGTPTAGLDETLAHVDQIGKMAINLLDQVSVVLNEVSTDIRPLLDNAERMLSAKNADNVEAALASMRELAEGATPRVKHLLDQLDTVAGDLGGDLEALPELTDRARDLVASLTTALGPDGARLTGVLDSAQVSLDAAGDTLSTLSGSREELAWTLRDLRDVVANLREFSQQVKERPFSLVRIKMPPDRRPGQGVPEGRP
ncbi:MAG: MlaD family protein [Acidobacteriota bacterium]